MGSLLPLSNSKVGRKLALSARFFDLRIENTAAASVEETIEPSNMLSYMVKSVISQTKVPKESAVNTTPKVESDTPFHKIGFTDFQLVSSPPEKRIKFNETIPINCAYRGSLK